MIDPALLAAAKTSGAVVLMGAFSTLHTALGKYPRGQALAQAAHALLTVNIPVLKSAIVLLCRAVVAHADGDDVTAAKDVELVANPLMEITRGPFMRAAEGMRAARETILPPLPSFEPLPAPVEPVAPPTVEPIGTVKRWT